MSLVEGLRIRGIGWICQVYVRFTHILRNLVQIVVHIIDGQRALDDGRSLVYNLIKYCRKVARRSLSHPMVVVRIVTKRVRQQYIRLFQ